MVDSIAFPIHRYLPLRDSASYSLSENSKELDNCTNGIQWIKQVFSDCVDTNVKLVGFIIGFISLLLWLLPLIPQLIQHFRTKRCEGLSIFFLLFWIVGDTCNMAGAILTNQQAMQKVIGCYYIFQDLVLLSQFFYYNKIYPSLRKRSQSSAMTSSTLVVPVLLLGFFAGSALLSSQLPLTAVNDDANFLIPTGRRLFYVKEQFKTPPFFNGYFDVLGYIFGSVSALCYFLGRIPQLIRNYNRKSCEGLSLLMFYIIISANFTYGVSVLLEASGWHYILRHLPWLAGSLGCCMCDIAMVTQYCHYEKLNRAKYDAETNALLSEDTDEDPQVGY